MESNAQRISRYLDCYLLFFAGTMSVEFVELLKADASVQDIFLKGVLIAIVIAVAVWRGKFKPDPVPPAKDTFMAWFGRTLCSALLLMAGACLLLAWGLHSVGLTEKSALYVLLAVFLAFAGWQRRPKLPMPPASYETDADELRIIETLAGDLLDSTDEPRAKMYANEIASGLFDRGWRKVAKELPV